MAWQRTAPMQGGIYFRTQILYQDISGSPATGVSAGRGFPIEYLPSGELRVSANIKEDDASRTRIIITPFEANAFCSDVNIPYKNPRVLNIERQSGTIQKLQVVFAGKMVRAMDMFVKFPSTLDEKISLLSGSIDYEASHSPDLDISDLVLRDTRCLASTLAGTIPKAVRDELARLAEVYPEGRHDLGYCAGLLF